MTDRRAERDRKRRERRKAREEAERRLEELREAWRRRRADEEEGKKRRCDARKAKVCALDRLLIKRFGGKVGRDQAVELTRQRNLTDGWEFCLPGASPYTARTVKSAPNRGIMPSTNKCLRQSEGSAMDVAERELDRMIERRSRRGESDPDEREELWKESVRRYNARRREENRRAWCEYFCRLAGSLRARAEEYDHRARALLEGRGEGGA